MEKMKHEIIEWMKSIAGAIILVLIIRAFFFAPIMVDGESMEPTLKDEDRMIVTKIGEPERFDIVVFHAPDGRDYIKRVIGLPGDRIEHQNDILYVNGKAYDEPYLESFREQISQGTLTESFTLEETAVGEETVPEGHLFVLGDNRRNSIDSREIGAVPFEEVVGTTNFVFYPFREFKIINNHNE